MSVGEVSPAPVWKTSNESSLQLRPSRRMEMSLAGSEANATDGAEPIGGPSPASAVREATLRSETGNPESSLRLSQGLVPGDGSPRTPNWKTSIEPPMQLRSTRTMGMPGGAGVGRLPAQEATQFSPAGTAEAGGGAMWAAAPPLAPVVAGAEASNSAASRGLAGSGWEIPPIRWGGSLGYMLQRSSSDSSASSLSQGILANLNASSYVYAPWFATVAGRIGLTTTSSSSSNPDSGTTEQNKSSNVVGGGDLSMFPSSRYPVRAYFDRADSRASGTIVAQDYVSTRFGLSHNYRAEDSPTNFSFMLDHSNVTTNGVASSSSRNDSVTALSGSASTQSGLWQHNLNGQYSIGQREGTGEEARLIGINSSHNATLSDTANVGAVFNYSDNDIRTADGSGGLFNNHGRFLQAYTFGSWMPDFEDLDDLPLTLNGSLRYSSQETQLDSTKSDAQSIGGNLSGLYRFSNNLTGSVNGAVNRVSLSQGSTSLMTMVGSNLNYVGNPLSFGKYSYNWNTGGSANWQSGAGAVSSSAALGLMATHSVARSISLDDGQSISLSYSQSLNVIDNQQIGTSESLSNNFSANYGLYAGDRFSGSLTGMLSDVNTMGVNAQHYTNFNLGLYGQGQMSQVSSLNLNMMFTWSDQTNKSMDAFGVQQTVNSQRMNINGSINYNNMRFAGVRGLRYNLLFVADSRLRDDRLYGNFNAEPNRSRFSLTNRLDYQIGLLNFRLSLTNNDQGGKKNALLFFQVTRQFGSY